MTTSPNPYAGYVNAIRRVLQQTDAYQRHFLKRRRLPGGIPHRFVGRLAVGPQCVTASLQIRDEDLAAVVGLGERLALAAGSEFARVYRDRAVVRVEFTLPPGQWSDVRLSGLPHHRRSATIGRKALGPVARLDWRTPHKAIFGSTQSGKTTCLADLIISLTRSHLPDDLRLLILNPKNDPALVPFERLAHLAAPVAVAYDQAVALLRFALAEMEHRRADPQHQRPRWVIVVDEIAQLTQVKSEAGPLLTQLSQLAGGLKINLVVASQAANPTVFGQKGSLAKANFPSRIVFRLPREQAYLATGLDGQQTDKLGGRGDGLAVVDGRVTRLRAALPEEGDYTDLPRLPVAPPMPPSDQLAGDGALTNWQVDPDRLAYALVVRNSANALRREFGGGMDGARLVRDYAALVQQRLIYWRQAGGRDK
jgi:hypothetical protein